VRIAGGVPVAVPCDDCTGFRLTADALDAAITPRTRWLLLNSPSNPTGSAYKEDDYRSLIGVLHRNPHVWLMVDDIYEHILYDGFRFVMPAALDAGLRDRRLTVDGVSNAYAMMGFSTHHLRHPLGIITECLVLYG
jgi:aspartate aminotransferase